MKFREFSLLEKKRRKKPRWAAYGPGPYGGYGYLAGYSGDGGSSVGEASYPGNIGMMEISKFFKIASEEEKKTLKDLIGKKKFKVAWNLIQRVTGVKLQGQQFQEDITADVVLDNGERKKVRYAPGRKNIIDMIIRYYLKQGLKVLKVNDEEIEWEENTVKENFADGSEQKYLWHGSRQKIDMLEPRQSVDIGGASGSNQNAIYATSDPKVAIAVGGLTTPDSDTAMFPNDPQMVLFKGKIRKGENVYLHKLPFYGPDGKPQFVQGANDREFYSIPSVKGIKPIEIKAVPVDKYLNLIRTATPQDLELRKQNMKQDVAENFADGRVKGRSRPGRVKRAGASCKGSVTDLRARAKKYGGERGKMYHWCANMKSGKK